MRHWANEQCVKDRQILKVAQNHGKVAIIWPPIHVTDLKKNPQSLGAIRSMRYNMGNGRIHTTSNIHISVFQILTENLGMWQVSTEYIP